MVRERAPFSTLNPFVTTDLQLLSSGLLFFGIFARTQFQQPDLDTLS